MIERYWNHACRLSQQVNRRLPAMTAFLVICLLSVPAQAGLRDKVKKAIDERKHGSGELDTNTIIAGLKEALSVGARNAVATVSQVDGYFGNQLIKVQTPEKIKKIEKVMRKAGFNKEVDQFVLSMNRAAEKAAPQALDFFTAAVRDMTITDAVQILRGNDTAATDYLKSKTYDQIFGAFKPVIIGAMNDVGVTRSFKQMMDKAKNLPLLKKETIDLDQYVTSRALDGLFSVVAREEQKIRKDPVARVTDLLKKVFKQ
jgi:RNA binding exosome subunit